MVLGCEVHWSCPSWKTRVLMPVLLLIHQVVFSKPINNLLSAITHLQNNYNSKTLKGRGYNSVIGSLPDEAQVGASEEQSNFKDLKLKKHNTKTVFLGAAKLLPPKSNCRVQLQSVISVCERLRQEDYEFEGRLRSIMRLSQKDKTKRLKVFIYKLLLSFDIRKLIQETISVLILSDLSF